MLLIFLQGLPVQKALKYYKINMNKTPSLYSENVSLYILRNVYLQL